MVIGLVVNAWIGWRLAESLHQPAAWLAALLLPLGFAVTAVGSFSASRQDSKGLLANWRPAKRLFIVGTLMVAIAAAVLAHLAMAPDVPVGTVLLAGLDALAIMATIGDAAAGRVKVATLALVILTAAMAWPLAFGSADMMRHTAAFGVVAHGAICFGIARSRHAKESRLLAARLAEQAARAETEVTNQRLQAALSFMSHGVLVTGGDGSVQFLNQRLRDLLGLEAEAAAIGASWEEVFRQASRLNMKSAAGRDGVVARTAALTAGRDSGTSVLRLDDGHILDCEFSRLEGGGFLALMRDTTDEAAARETLERDVRRCPLTGVGNRRAFQEELDRLLAVPGATVVLALGDLKSFKAINDSYGHPVGDQVLTQIALRLQSTLASAFVARLGGDEFAVLSPLADDAAAAALAERVHGCLMGLADIDGLVIETEGRVGYAVAPADGVSGIDLLRRADLALINARQVPGATIMRFAPALEAAMRTQITEEHAVARVLNDGRLGIAYQPWFRLRDGEALGVEALARWPAGEAFVLSPAQLIHRTETMGRMTALRGQIMSQALAELAGTGLEVAVNVSALELAQPGFAEQIIACAAAARFPLNALVLEVTESALHASPAQSAAELGRLRTAGVHVAIDDFGSGFSTLSSLAQLPVDRLKLDRSLLVPGIDRHQSVVLAAAVRIGLGLGLETVVEGIETDAQLQSVAALGADIAQGFLLSTAVSRSELAAAMASGTGRLRRLLAIDDRPMARALRS